MTEPLICKGLINLTLNTDAPRGCIGDVGSNIRQANSEVAGVEIAISGQYRRVGQGTVEDELPIVITVGGIVYSDVNPLTIVHYLSP